MFITKIRFNSQNRILIQEDSKTSLLAENVTLSEILSQKDPKAYISSLSSEDFNGEYEVLAPVDDHDVWGTGVTYFNSKMARNEESNNKTTLYEYVYDSKRPQIFYKSRGRNVVPTNGNITLREDSNWTVPEPELVLVMNSHGEIVGYTSGNDVSCRDIEGENALFQLQAKVWDGACSLGPSIILCDESELKTLPVEMKIYRGNEIVFSGETNTEKIVREFSSLAGFVFQSRSFPEGTFLFTGTGIIPEESFSLKKNDRVEIKVGKNNILINGVI